MQVSPMNISGLTKLCHAKPGELVQIYSCNLQPEGFYIAGEIPGNVFNPVIGVSAYFNPSTRCKIYKGAQIVTDFIEGAR